MRRSIQPGRKGLRRYFRHESAEVSATASNNCPAGPDQTPTNPTRAPIDTANYGTVHPCALQEIGESKDDEARPSRPLRGLRTNAIGSIGTAATANCPRAVSDPTNSGHLTTRCLAQLSLPDDLSDSRDRVTRLSRPCQLNVRFRRRFGSSNTPGVTGRRSQPIPSAQRMDARLLLRGEETGQDHPHPPLPPGPPPPWNCGECRSG